MRALDLTNKRFGKLVALMRAPKRNDKYTRWICQCDCGNVAEIRTDYLTSNHTTSCGCIKQTYFGGKKEEILSSTYGRLHPVEFDIAKSLYKCQCDCGNITYVEGYNLISGNTQSCGCLKSKGELKINSLLTEMGVNYRTQYSFEDCIFPDTQRLAKFDYAIFENEKLLGIIEYDGTQHYSGWGQKEESLLKIQQKDAFKDAYCALKNISCIRISYQDYANLNQDYLLKIIDKMRG